MTDYEERYEGNGEDVETFGGGSSPQARANSHGGGPDDFSDSKSQVLNLLSVSVIYLFIFSDRVIGILIKTMNRIKSILRKLVYASRKVQIRSIYFMLKR